MEKYGYYFTEEDLVKHAGEVKGLTAIVCCPYCDETWDDCVCGYSDKAKNISKEPKKERVKV